jgi:hypothetical protein
MTILLPPRLRHFLLALLGIAAGAPAMVCAQVAPAAAELHCLQVPLSPAARTQAATLIVEAEVLDAVGTWDAAHQRIYTRQRLRVFQVMKGSLPDTAALTLVVEGGQVGLARQELTNTLRPLAAGQQGVFFLVPSRWQGVGGPKAYTAYASEQGVIAYDLTTGTAADPFRSYPTWAAAVTEAAAGQAVRQVQPNPRRAVLLQPKPRQGIGPLPLAAAVSSLSPTQLAAGVGAVLTIRGSGFGATRGSGGVFFKNADDGGATTDQARPTDYLSWSDTQIQVRVPSLGVNNHPAGTGTVRVVAADGTTADSSTPLTIVYALANVGNTTGTLVDQPNHIATNTTGGITFHFGTNFQNSSAAAPWQRALTQWRCSTGINWELGPAATTNTIANDDQNIIAFDPGTDLPANILGRTTTYYQGCYDPQGNVVFYVHEVDQEYASPGNISFQFGPALAVGAQVDFESVATHELGHAQQLSHIIRPGAIMHYVIARGQNLRTLSTASDIAGGRRELRSRSFRNRGCGGPAMLPAPLTALAAETGTAVPTLAFTTRDECFLTGFVLERSVGGIDTTAWQSVATAGAGVAGNQYRLADPQPPEGLYYYRLGLRRPNGTIDYAAPIAVNAGAVATGSQLFPNPVVDNQARLTYSSATAATLTLSFYDEVGRLHRRAFTSVQAGLNVLTLDLIGLPTGFYILRMASDQGGSESIRLVRL